MASDLTILIQTCQGYSDLWQPHLDFLSRNWPDCPFRRLLVTDAPTQRRFPGIEVVSAGAGLHMPRRLAAVLPEIRTEFVLLTLDDYFPVSPISTEAITRLTEVMEREELDYIRLFPDPPPRGRYPGIPGLHRVDLGIPYAVNLYPGIWRTSFLEATLPGPEDIWAYEVSLTHTARRLGAGCAMTRGREFPILDVIRKGKILHRAKQSLFRRGIVLAGRDTVPRLEELRIYLFNHGKRYLPQPLARWVKKGLNRLGYTFFTDEYEETYDGYATH